MDTQPSPTAWILGAGPGIGRATARRFRDGGLQVGVLAHPELPPEPGLHLCHADLFRPAATESALEALEAAVGLPEVMVYNASCGEPGPLGALAPETAAGLLEAAARSLLQCVARVRPAMARAGHGTILITGGGLAFSPKPGLALPSAVKALQRSLALSLAEELAPQGIHVATLAICGFVQPGTALSPESVAEALWGLHREAPGTWRQEARLP